MNVSAESGLLNEWLSYLYATQDMNLPNYYTNIIWQRVILFHILGEYIKYHLVFECLKGPNTIWTQTQKKEKKNHIKINTFFFFIGLRHSGVSVAFLVGDHGY